MIRVEIRNKDNDLVVGKIDHEKEYAPYCVEAEKMAVLAIKDYQYQEGDRFVIRCDNPEHRFFVVQLEETLAPTLLYIPEEEWVYHIPMKESERKAMVDTAFLSRRHHIVVREAYDFEIFQYRNLSFNAYDQKDFMGAYPHASANVETRNEAVFFAKNAIDGRYGNLSHGSYPFSSWGINQQRDAELKIDFGRIVEVDCIQFLFRGDYPHDSYWTKVTLKFSDGEEIQVPTTDSLGFQVCQFSKKETEYIKFKDLMKNEDASTFPALTQIEVFGKYIRNR